MSPGLEGTPAARTGRSAEELAPQLLAFLRAHEHLSGLEFSSPPALLAGGFDTTTVGFALADPPAHLDSGLVLRLFRREDNPDREASSATESSPGRNSSACANSSSTLRPAASAATVAGSSSSRKTCRVLRPMEPVEPSREIRITAPDAKNPC